MSGSGGFRFVTGSCRAIVGNLTRIYGLTEPPDEDTGDSKRQRWRLDKKRAVRLVLRAGIIQPIS